MDEEGIGSPNILPLYAAHIKIYGESCIKLNLPHEQFVYECDTIRMGGTETSQKVASWVERQEIIMRKEKSIETSNRTLLSFHIGIVGGS